MLRSGVADTGIKNPISYSHVSTGPIRYPALVSSRDLECRALSRLKLLSHSIVNLLESIMISQIHVYTIH